ncbi:MAG: indole-3-glycerol-phosphate synthase [Bacteroidales bacterium]|jgi:indole-3-glycerol phosphate synthase|nr:indole-3-glycerol-phosphate synthase [Bacteroidales bacterium]
MDNQELHLTDVLSDIIKTKREELAALMAPKRSLRRALAESETGIIAEFKRKSPSKGWIHADVRPEEVVPAYAAAGAAALSILTDEPYFGGSLDYIRRVRPLVDIPILRKDFIIDPFQLYQAAEAGADAVLLIAACLSRNACAALTAEAHRLGLEVLLEIHSPEELDYVTPEVDVVGVNNRHLGTFVTDVQTSFDLAPLLIQRAGLTRRADGTPSTTPAHATRPILISESGLSDPATVRRLREAGFRGFLMGEQFMKQSDPGAALADFIQAL